MIAQGSDDISFIEIDSAIYYSDDSELSLEQSPFHYSTILGTACGFIPGIGSASHIYAAPQLDYRHSDRLSLQGGMMFMQSVSTLPVLNTEFNSSSSYSMFSVYISASYQVTENLSVHGTGIKGLINPFSSDELVNSGYNDLSFGATYSFGNFSIGATIHTSDMGGFYGPFHSSGIYGSPLIW